MTGSPRTGQQKLLDLVNGESHQEEARHINDALDGSSQACSPNECVYGKCLERTVKDQLSGGRCIGVFVPRAPVAEILGRHRSTSGDPFSQR